jgi:hypothetical protein
MAICGNRWPWQSRNWSRAPGSWLAANGWVSRRFCARADDGDDPRVQNLRDSLIALENTEAGRAALRALLLDGMAPGGPEILDQFALRMNSLAALR